MHRAGPPKIDSLILRLGCIIIRGRPIRRLCAMKPPTLHNCLGPIQVQREPMMYGSAVASDIDFHYGLHADETVCNFGEIFLYCNAGGFWVSLS